eukprot:NODE_2_length_91304_cov_0.692462.p59 type:complete len:175 gc:universal NODE_2_length_91304_cov_0.692462:49478-48954(-)
MSDSQVLDMIFSGPIDGYTFTDSPKDYPSFPACKEVDPQLRENEIMAVLLAEDGKYDESLQEMTRLISKNPNYYSLYNNRAQIFRITGKNEEALQDLNHVIENCNDPEVLKQSHTQRAIVLKSAGHSDSSYTDFCRAAELGQSIARKATVYENPYRKLCSSMVKTVLEREMRTK